MADSPGPSYEEKYLALQKEFEAFKAAAGQQIEMEKFNAIKALTTDMAHDLNQPLNVTKIICQGILRDIEKGRFSLEDAKNDLPEILNQMNRMADTITRIRSPYRQISPEAK